MNNGLKKITKQITNEIGAASVSVNPCGNSANMHITLPLVTTIGLDQFGASLIYNHQDKDVDGIFGKGFKLNYYGKKTEDGSTITMKNADGSTDTYTLDEWNEETQLKPSLHYESSYNLTSNLIFEDRVGNTRNYTTLSEYPESITMKSGESLTFSFISEIKRISNGKGDVVSFIPNDDGLIGVVEYSHDETNLTSAHLSYTNGKLSKVTYYSGQDVTSSISITSGIDYIMTIDDVSAYRIKYTFTNGKVSSILDGFDDSFTNGNQMIIEYGDNRSVITDSNNKKVYLFFDNEGIPLYEMSEEGYVVKTGIDNESKQVLSQSSSIAVKEDKLTNIFATESVLNYTKTNVEVENVVCNDVLLSDILGNSVCRVTGTESASGGLTMNVASNGIATDNLTAIIWGKQLTPCTDTCYVGARLSINGEYSELVKFDKKTVDGNFDIIVLGLTASKTYSNVSLTIMVEGNASIELGGIQVLKKDFGSFYQYDENGNNVYTLSSSGTTTTEYSSNLPSKSINQASQKAEYTFNEGKLTKTLGAYGVVTEYNYDSTNPSNLIKTEVINDDENKIMQTTKEYTSDGRFVSKTTDELGNSTSYVYDNLGKVKKVTNALSEVAQYTYNSDETLKSLALTFSGDALLKAEYTYDDRKRLTGISLANGSKYTFTYDNYNNISTVTLNGSLIFTYEYDTKGNITKQRYGRNGDGYLFEYSDDGRLIKVHYMNNSWVTTRSFSYEYNDKKQLVKITEGTSNIIAEYTYDDNGNVVKNSSASKSITYSYDNLGNVINKSTKVSNKTINTSYDSVARSKGSQPDSLMAAFKNKNCYIFTYDRITNSLSQRAGKDGVISYAKTNNKNLEYTYGLPITEDNSGCFQFWFKADSTSPSSSQRCLMTVKNNNENSTNSKCAIRVYLVNNDVKLAITDRNGTEKTLLTMSSCVNLSEWNFVSVDYMYRDDGLGYKAIAEYALTVNSKTQVYNFSDTDIVNINLGASEMAIGFDSINNSKLFASKVTAVYFSRDHLILEDVKKYYRLSKDYLIENELVYSGIESVDFGATSLYTMDASIQNQFEIYPLQNSVQSLNGKKPSAYTKRINSEEDKDASFNFNKKIRRYAYVADGGELAYNQGEVTDITIAMMAFTDIDEDKQYFFEGVDQNGKTLGLYRNKDKKVCIDHNGTTYITDLTFTTDEWHSIALSRTKRIAHNSLTQWTECSLRVMVDGTSYTKTTLSGPTYSDLSVMIGRKYNTENHVHNLGESRICYPLYGQIEMLAIAEAYCEESTINNLFDSSKCTTKVNYYDDFGMHNQMEIQENGDSVLRKVVAYKVRESKYISNQVWQEGFFINNSYVIREYTKDALGRVTAINNQKCYGITLDDHTYSYDKRGYLISANGVSYTYDKNGNVTKIGDKVLTYDSTIKDRLMSYDGNSITYDSKNSFNVSSYKGNYYTFEGRRLTKITNSSGYWEYTYNDLGLRTKKCNQDGTITYYEYDGDKLIYEKSSTARLDFLYDENGELYGFIKDSTDKYFYIRDCLKNILGIIDSEGKLVVKYNCEAYGKCAIVSDTSGCSLGSLNPFRYKGYYYDSETGMYYCQSRYYVPDWCRWLNADNLNFLEPQSLNGLNLFAYCSNDPVNNCDPSGCFALSAFLIGLAASAIASWALTEIFGHQIAGGICSSVSGATAICTGASLLSFGPVGWIAGGALILIGAGTMAFGVNEIVAGATGTNYIQSWSGMSDVLYEGLYIGFESAAFIGTIAGGIYMSYANVTGGKAELHGKAFSRHSTMDDLGVKQYRFYDSKGNAWYDKDFRHQIGHEKFPHYHGWVNTDRTTHLTFWDLIKWLFRR